MKSANQYTVYGKGKHGSITNPPSHDNLTSYFFQDQESVERTLTSQVFDLHGSLDKAEQGVARAQAAVDKRQATIDAR